MWPRQPVVCGVLPLRDDATIKEYLLKPERRGELMLANDGAVHTLGGGGEVGPLVRERTFVCLHYHLDENGTLSAMAPGAARWYAQAW